MIKRYSIIQNEKKCIVCGTIQNIHIHECFFGKNRQLSIKDGLCVYLCGRHHNQSNEGVHGKNGHELDIKLKQIAERNWIEYYDKKIDDFISRYGKNWL